MPPTRNPPHGLRADDAAAPAERGSLRDAGGGLRPGSRRRPPPIVSGTIAYTLGNGWSLVDGFYFAVATLTTTSVSDPDLVLNDGWMKVFTAFYILVGIGVLVEIVRRIGAGFVAAHREQEQAKRARRQSRSS